MNSKIVFYTTRLTATPSFFAGMCRALDLGGTFDSYNTSNSEAEADVSALENDWDVVGNDLEDAISLS